MEDYQERVIIEQKELGEKICSLTAFIVESKKYGALLEEDRNLLYRQLEIMLELNLILQTRIFNF